MTTQLYDDGIGYVTDEVSEILPANANDNEENRVKYITDIAVISRGKTKSSNPNMLYKQLLTEAAPTYIHTYSSSSTDWPMININGIAGRPFEFLPITLILTVKPNLDTGIATVNILNASGTYYIPVSEIYNAISRHSYVTAVKQVVDSTYAYTLHTNMRTLLNAGIKYEDIPYNNTTAAVGRYALLKAMVPMFVWAQFPMTHTMISKISQSDRVTDSTYFWLPKEIREHLNMDPNKYTIENTITGAVAVSLVKAIAPNIPKEIYNRAYSYFKYKTVIFGGYLDDPAAFTHALLERNAYPTIYKNWTQEQTAEFVTAVSSMLYVNNNFIH